MLGRIHQWDHQVLGHFSLRSHIYPHHGCCRRLLPASVLVDDKLEALHLFLLGDPAYWYIGVHNSLLRADISMLLVVMLPLSQLNLFAFSFFSDIPAASLSIVCLFKKINFVFFLQSVSFTCALIGAIFFLLQRMWFYSSFLALGVLWRKCWLL